MELQDIKLNTMVKNIKHGCFETIVGICKMKNNGEWVDGILYTGKDRYTGMNALFCKSFKEFKQEFEIIN